MKNRRETLNIALIDLNHMTMGVHTNTIPLGAGAIAYYLKKNVEHKFDIKIFKDPNKFLHTLEKWTPDIAGIAQYAWNSELNLHTAQLIKKRNPDCVFIAGGPNLYVFPEEKYEYLKRHPFIDVCVNYDGEIPFTEIVRRLLAGETIEDIRRLPAPGTYSIDPARDKLVQSEALDPRLESLDVFGSMYAEGFFDVLLRDGFHPFLQTQRGCPFRCAYCHTGNKYSSRVILQSFQHFRKDMEYLGKHFQGQHNIFLYMANTNFGLFKEDFEIARIIRQMQDKYDWPKNISVNTAHRPDNIFKLVSILKYKFPLALSVQTLTPKVLKNIGRKNVSFKEFTAFQKRVTQHIDEKTNTELILNLPEETKKSFLNVISRILDSGVQHIAIYTLMALRGTALASPEAARRYGHVIRYRMVPRCFSDIGGAKIFETEEVVVGTKSMPFEDYISLRELSLVIYSFVSSLEMFPLRKFLMEHGLSIASWVYGIQKRIPDFPNLYSAYKAFIEETKDELFMSRDSLVDFYNKQDNYDLLRNGKLGDNLLRKYKAIILSRHYRESLEVAFLELRRQAEGRFDLDRITPLIEDLKFYLRERDVGHIFKDGYGRISSKNALLRYDVIRWIEQKDKGELLEGYKGQFPYKIVITDYMRDRLKSFMRMNREREFSMQVLYRDGYIKDFWPVWVRKGAKSNIEMRETKRKDK